MDYQERIDQNTRWTDRIVSTAGDWSGNLYDFYFRVYNKIVQDIKVPFKLEGGNRIDDTPVHKALREALANCLINADYYGRQGLVIIKKQDVITFSNPGGFRIDVEVAKAGGISDPRNGALIKMFNLVEIGERAGSGIPNIYSVWKKEGWIEPAISESFDPERITLLLSIGKTDDKKPTIKTDDKKPTIKSKAKTELQKELIIEYLTDNASATNADLCNLLGLQSTRVKELLSALIADGIVVSEGANRNRRYRLKR